MEAARALPALPQRLRSRRFARECEALRPLGIAFVLRRFGNTLDYADAEDAVAEVVIRLHRQAQAGRSPDNLRAVFFTACRNAAIDQLRSRAAKPAVALEAVAEVPTANPTPEERAESRDDAIRLREALARMRPNYREAIVLRFGLGLTVPEIAERLQISLPAAKKLVLRSTDQIRERLEAIEGAQFCPEMRDLVRRSLFDREAAGLANEAESAVLRAHFEHCGSCRSFLARLRADLHELGSGALLAGYVAGRTGLVHHLGTLPQRFGHAAQAGLERVRLLAFRTAGSLRPEDPSAAGALAGTGQKFAAICTAGAASAATCLATGIVGPGLGVASQQTPPLQHHQRPSAQIRLAPPERAAPSLETVAPAEASAPRRAEGARAGDGAKSRRLAAASVREAEPTASEREQSEFGFEHESEPTPTTQSPPPQASASAATSTPSAGPKASTGASAGGAESFGFHG